MCSKTSQAKPKVFFTEIKQPQGRLIYQVVTSEAPTLWPVFTKFSDGDMSRGSRHVLFCML